MAKKKLINQLSNSFEEERKRFHDFIKQKRKEEEKERREYEKKYGKIESIMAKVMHPDYPFIYD